MFDRMMVIQEAKSWINTPYIKMGRVKGAGADCFSWISETFIACGIMTREQMPTYGHDWWAHTDMEHYIFRVARFATKIAELAPYKNADIKPATVILARLAGSKVYNHGALVTKWPRAIHAIQPCVAEIDVTRNEYWIGKRIAVFDPWRKQE